MTDCRARDQQADGGCGKEQGRHPVGAGLHPGSFGQLPFGSRL
ncbi:hypothetical protein [Streptomyces sp. NPDC001222]